MKLNDIDFYRLTDKELVALCLKYKMIQQSEIPQLTRKILLSKIKEFLKRKLQVYGQKKDPNVKSISVDRRMSISGNLQKHQIGYQTNNGPPRPNVQRRMSHPITSVEKVQAQQTHEINEIRENTTNEVKQELTSMNPKYDIVGMFPPVKKLIAIGDLHGDLRVTLLALKLAEVIPQTTTEQNINRYVALFRCRNFLLILASLIYRNMTWTLVVDLTMSFPYEDVKDNEGQHCKRTTKTVDILHVPGNFHR